MSSPNGDEVLSVDTKAGAAVLRSLGWTEEGGSSAAPSSDESSEPARRKPGRPRKHPRPEDEATESTEG